MPDQLPCRLAEAALADLSVAGCDEVELQRQPVTVQMVTPVHIQRRLERLLEVQVADELLEGLGAYRQMGGSVVALRGSAPEQAVEYLEGGPVVIEAGCREGFHQP
ncbi:hypothetical protein D3C81_1372400 [compost metagenome]